MNERCRLFYKLFTRKEAYCKALGVGLQHAPSGLRLDSPASIGSQVYDEDEHNISPFFVYHICSIHGYAATVCLSHSEARLSLFKVKPRKL
jgi:phosphopantetheinyl transferase